LAGCARIWTSILPKTPYGRLLKNAVSVAIGGGLALLLKDYLGPLFLHNSTLIAPFALANATASMFWYSLGELTLGLETLMTLSLHEKMRSIFPFLGRYISLAPLAGSGIGFLTALTAPILWQPCMNLIWGQDLLNFILGDDKSWVYDIYFNLAIPVGLPVGILSGISLHAFLGRYITGTPG
jgi:hypothetical protein